MADTATTGTYTDDVRELARQLLDAIPRMTPPQWSENAGALTWTRWETAEHVADDLLSYAARLAVPGYAHDIPFQTTRRREGAPDELVHATDDSGPIGLAAVIEASANLLIAIVEATPETVTASHVYGDTGAKGFAAMSVVELIVHGHDIFSGTEVDWAPDGAACGRVLHRLFPDVEPHPDDETVGVSRFDLLLWATGRIALPTRGLRSEWRWFN